MNITRIESEKIRAAVLGIGTELTSGQILNGNARWLSKELWTFGISTCAHLTVPDDRPLILQALRFLANQCELLFLTGGLGPTVDDFTREVVNEWTGDELVFHENSMKMIEEKLSARGMKPREAHRQECYFPSQSRVLVNPVGTANAFALKFGNTEVYVLPGPPKEIEGIWRDWIVPDLQKLAPQLDPGRTWAWDCIGIPESELAALAESVLVGCPFEKAYRVHLPYVEFKLTALESERSQVQPWAEAVTKILAPYTIARNGEDPAQFLAQEWLKLGTSIDVIDEVTGSSLLGRLLPVNKELLNKGQFQFLQKKGTSSWQFQIRASANTHEAMIDCQGPNGDRQTWTIQSPKVWHQFPDREKQYYAELAIVNWLHALKDQKL